MEARYPMPTMLSKGFVGTILSHQFYCDLNYLVLEGLYTGVPIVHNSEFCKDAGYFYKEFNADGCVEMLKTALTSHDQNNLHYNSASREVLYRFSAKNTENKKGYIQLIENIS